MSRVRRHIACWLIGTALALSGCAVVPLQAVQLQAKADRPTIVVVRSNANQIFDGPVSELARESDASIHVYQTIDDVDPDRLEAGIRALKPALIVAFGGKAASLLSSRIHDVPILFAMVVNHEQYGLHKAPNVMGVALEPSPEVEFTMFKMILPNLRRVVAFYSPDLSATAIEVATRDLAKIGVTLDAVPVAQPSELPARYAEHAKQHDAVWVFNDQRLLAPETFGHLVKHSRADRLPLLASVSEELAKQGALMAVGSDFIALGSQAAVMARSVIEEGVKPSDIGVQAPIGAKLVINETVARELGIKVPAGVSQFVVKIAGTP